MNETIKAILERIPPEKPDDDDDEDFDVMSIFRVWFDGHCWCASAATTGSGHVVFGHGENPVEALKNAEVNLHG